MSVLVKRMKMPIQCVSCPMWTIQHVGEKIVDWCREGEFVVNPYQTGRDSECPLVKVPTPHGRLIDADELKKDLTRFYDGCVTAKQLIDEQSTVIDAEEFPDWCFEDCDCLDGECPYYVKDGCRLAGDSE